MDLSERELWAVGQGLVLGLLFLLTFAGVLAAIWRLRDRLIEREARLENTKAAVAGDIAEHDRQVGFSPLSDGTHLPFSLGRQGAHVQASSSTRG